VEELIGTSCSDTSVGAFMPSPATNNKMKLEGADDSNSAIGREGLRKNRSLCVVEPTDSVLDIELDQPASVIFFTASLIKASSWTWFLVSGISATVNVNTPVSPSTAVVVERRSFMRVGASASARHAPSKPAY
jgi:hypothetical protein